MEQVPVPDATVAAVLAKESCVLSAADTPSSSLLPIHFPPQDHEKRLAALAAESETAELKARGLACRLSAFAWDRGLGFTKGLLHGASMGEWLACQPPSGVCLSAALGPRLAWRSHAAALLLLPTRFACICTCDYAGLVRAAFSAGCRACTTACSRPIGSSQQPAADLQRAVVHAR